VIDFFVRFPMFTTVDIDWEYPGGSGLGGNEFSEDDGKNYALLIGELRTALDKQFPSARKRITTAAGADVAKLERADIPGLIAAGLDSVFLMTYDYFGTGWAEAIAHHTNLHSSPIGPYSIEAAVDYLVNQGVSPDKLNIGYANYGRAAAKADLHTREYDRQGNALGSYENGSPEFYDTLNNYLDLEQGTAQGKNGFTLMTDTGADADILFNEQTGHYISTDTPRTVKAKGEYALQKGLGGVFSWSADQDNGLLANAAREGMGYQVTKTVFDMSSVYNPGEKFELGK
jgi:chitinase